MHALLGSLAARDGLMPSLREMGRLWSVQGLISTMPRGMVGTPRGVHFSVGLMHVSLTAVYTDLPT